MNRTLLSVLVFGLAFGGSFRAGAIAVEDYSVAESPPADAGLDLDLSYVYAYKGGSAVAISRHWILTTAQLAVNGSGSGDLEVDGETYRQREVVIHPTADLALVRYDKRFPGYYSLMDGEIYHEEAGGWFPFWGSDKVWHLLVVAGYGCDGTVSRWTFGEGDSGGILRWGTNRGVGEATVPADRRGALGDRSTSCFQMDFDLSDTECEAGANPGDFGGPVFATNSVGEWAVAGIVCRRIQDFFGNYTGNYAVKVADYVDWIKSVAADYDSDRDGLPDLWERQFEGDDTQMDPNADDDGDGVSNYNEWMADTIPTNCDSHFEMLKCNPSDGIVFTSSTNRQYLIEDKLDLANSSEDWNPDLGWVVGADGQMRIDPSELEGWGVGRTRIYRIRVRLNE